MTKVLVSDTSLVGIASALREVGQTSASFTPSEMGPAVLAMAVDSWGNAVTGGQTVYCFGKGVYGLKQIATLELPNCTSVGNRAFIGCSKLTSVSLPNCTSVGNRAFSSCSSLTSLELPNCTSVGSRAFSSCSSLTSLYLLSPTLCTAEGPQEFSNSDIEIWVPWHLLSAYKSATYWSAHADKFVTSSSVDTVYTVNLPLEGTVTFIYGQSVLSKVTGTSCTVSVLKGTLLSYKVSIPGYRAISGTMQSDSDYAVTIAADQLEEEPAIAIDLSYPFFDAYGLLSNLVDGANFEISASPTPYTSSAAGMQASIVSIGTGKRNAVRFGYIKFHTPATTDTSMLTVSVTCNAYAEARYDTGVVFIDKTLHAITERLTLSSSKSGTTSTTYGYILYNSYGLLSSAYGTYTKVLEADTDYYLHFVYTTDSSSSIYWDRLSITSIKFTTTDAVLPSASNMASLMSLADGVVQATVSEQSEDASALISTVESEITEAQKQGDEEKVLTLQERLTELYTQRDGMSTVDESTDEATASRGVVD